jgi:hypothetical protein
MWIEPDEVIPITARRSPALFFWIGIVARKGGFPVQASLPQASKMGSLSEANDPSPNKLIGRD